ncbi:MAG: UbiA family prenyltransferase [Verrucomicrobiota bacterium]
MMEFEEEDEVDCLDESSPQRTLAELARLPNIPSVCTNVVAAWILTGADWGFRIIPLLLGASLLYAFGTALNDVMDAKFDAEKRPERPLPSGHISKRGLWIFTATCGIGGLVATCWWGGASVIWTLTLVATIVAYDAVHKHWSGGCVLMGSCRWLLYFVGASSATGDLAFTGPVLLWATVLGCYIIGLTYYAREEADPEAPPVIRWPLLLLLGPEIAWGIGVILLEHSKASFFFVLLFLAWRIFAVIEVRQSESPDRIGTFVTRLLAGIILLDAVAVGTVSFWAAIVVLGAFPLTLLLQREFEAT